MLVENIWALDLSAIAFQNPFSYYCGIYDDAQKKKFSIKGFFSVNETKSIGNCEFGHVY